jgi:hypothetical protein
VAFSSLVFRSRAPNGLTPVVKSRIYVASLRYSSVKDVEYSPSSRLGPLATAQSHSVHQPVRCSSCTPQGMFGAALLLKGELFQKNVVATDALKAQGLTFVTNVYLDTAVVLAVFTLAVFFARKTIAAHAPLTSRHAPSPFRALASKWANLGALAILGAWAPK